MGKTKIYNKDQLMHIEPGITYRNKTLQYLAPCIKSWGKEFQYALFQNHLLACGVADRCVDDEQIPEDRIYILIDIFGEKEYDRYEDISISRIQFFEFLEWFTGHPSYHSDYIYDPKKENYHMVVANIPKRHKKNSIVSKFINGDYSQMYQEKDWKLIKKIKKVKKHYLFTDEYQVVTRKKGYEKIFQKKIQRDFNTNITIDNIKDIEWDYPPVLKQEVFNWEVDCTAMTHANYEVEVD